MSAAATHPSGSGVPAALIARVERHLRRLEALAARHRFRQRIVRAVRGSAGAGTTLLALTKAKLVGSLAGKVAIAALVGLGLAWPLVALGVLTLAVLVVSILDCDPTGLDGCDCLRPNARRARLRALIAERRTWLAAPSGPVPGIRRGPRPQRS